MAGPARHLSRKLSLEQSPPKPFKVAKIMAQYLNKAAILHTLNQVGPSKPFGRSKRVPQTFRVGEMSLRDPALKKCSVPVQGFRIWDPWS